MCDSPRPQIGDQGRNAPASPHARRASDAVAPGYDPVHDSDVRSAARIHSIDGTDGAETAPCVLVADDDPDMRDSLRMILEDAGYGVVEAADGIAAMDALHMNTAPFVVLLDVLLPGMSGYEILLHVAADPVLHTRHAYCLLTAVQLTDERIGPRFNDLITSLDGVILAKPFDLEMLLDCVAGLWARLLTRKQARTAQSPGTAKISNRTTDAAADNGEEVREDREDEATA